ncbi:DUF2267 domain-containing protein [Rhizobium sp. SG570]|uniref:DUF2267 domain-containing protein n=1 Tax=Rhizobium sp. SG570 TaxID=2587113 RepID=UPI0014475F49|nr:DUF2267 domain-containing protein [Rhizobium sp. SG570]NKJ38370.1 uncharacterized protein (DUF2267 family) [Rhizobium sp. SG570]
MSFIPSQTFSDSAHQAEIWVVELSEYLHCERNEAYDCLRSVLHALRDSMDLKAMADFSSHLPPLIRGIFYENWQPQRAQPCSDRMDFFASIGRRSVKLNDIGVEQAARNVFKLLDHHLSLPVIKRVKLAMNPSLGTLWPERPQQSNSAA